MIPYFLTLEFVLEQQKIMIEKYGGSYGIVDGNKRIGTFAALAFLDINGIEIITDPDDLADFVLSITRGEVNKNQIADYLQNHAKPIHPERKAE